MDFPNLSILKEQDVIVQDISHTNLMVHIHFIGEQFVIALMKKELGSTVGEKLIQVAVDADNKNLEESYLDAQNKFIEKFKDYLDWLTSTYYSLLEDYKFNKGLYDEMKQVDVEKCLKKPVVRVKCVIIDTPYPTEHYLEDNDFCDDWA